MRKAEGSTKAERAAAVETEKPKEAIARLRARCWKGSLLWGLQRTGEIINSEKSFRLKCNFSPSETLVLPILTFVLILIYSAIAISFYNNDA